MQFTTDRNLLPLPFSDSFLKTHDINKLITSKFGDLRYVTGKGWMAHSGIDIAVPVGTELVAPDICHVHKICRVDPQLRDKGYGNYIQIRFLDGAYGRDRPELSYYMMLAHCSEIDSFKRHQVIDKGGLLALSGNSGNSTGAHVHISLGTNLGFNGYCERKEDATTIGFVDGGSHFDIDM